MTFTGTATEFRQAWVCYTASIYDDINSKWHMIYVGHCALSEFHLLTDAKNNSEWREKVKAWDRLTIVPMSFHKTESEAKTIALISGKHVHCNMTGHVIIGASTGKVRNITTNEEYANASQAAKAARVSTSQMSNHLNNKPGYRTIRGDVYERI